MRGPDGGAAGARASWSTRATRATRANWTNRTNWSNRTNRACGAGVAGAIVLAGLSACAQANPAGAVGLGVDADGAYVAVVRLCDEGRTYTHAALAGPDQTATDAAISWIGRSVEPITFFDIGDEPPDNFVVESTGPVDPAVEYTFRISGDDLELSGAAVGVDRLDELQRREVIAPDGSTQDVDDFLRTACG